MRLAVIEEVPAGRVATRPVGPGTATRIMTGAPMPAGADTVLPVEQSETAADAPAILVRRRLAPGTNVRRAGEDMKQGATVLPAGRAIRAAGSGCSPRPARPARRRSPVPAWR